MQGNKRALIDLLREQEAADSQVITTDAFVGILERMRAPVQSEDLMELFSIYDKKKEGLINYDDFISEQKYIHAVSNVQSTVTVYSTVFVHSTSIFQGFYFLINLHTLIKAILYINCGN